MNKQKIELAAIRADELYPCEIIEKRLGIGRQTLRLMFQRGLPRRQIGRRACIIGADLIEFVSRRNAESAVQK